MDHRTQKKNLLRSILQSGDEGKLLTWAAEERNPDKALYSLLFDADPLVQQRAVWAMGKVAALFAESGMERARRIVEQALWQMNDESGGVLWNGPEVIASVLIAVPSLLDAYGRILASFLREEPFEKGAHWAVAQLVKIKPGLFKDDIVVNDLKNSLRDPDPDIRAHAQAALKELGEDPAP